MADPAHADLAGAEHAGDGVQGGFGLVDEGGVHGVHEAAVDLAGGLPHHGQDGDRDQHFDHREAGLLGGPHEHTPSAETARPDGSMRMQRFWLVGAVASTGEMLNETRPADVRPVRSKPG